MKTFVYTIVFVLLANIVFVTNIFALSSTETIPPSTQSTTSSLPDSTSADFSSPTAVGGVNVAGAGNHGQASLSALIKNVANYSLGLMGLFALLSGRVGKIMKVGFLWLGTTFVFYVFSLVAE